jgi:hypothetical protein
MVKSPKLVSSPKKNSIWVYNEFKKTESEAELVATISSLNRKPIWNQRVCTLQK